MTEAGQALVRMIRGDCLGRDTRQTLESALRVMRDEADNALHREDWRAACDYSLEQNTGKCLKKIGKTTREHSPLRNMRSGFGYLYTGFYGCCCLLGNYKIA